MALLRPPAGESDASAPAGSAAPQADYERGFLEGVLFMLGVTRPRERDYAEARRLLKSIRDGRPEEPR